MLMRLLAPCVLAVMITAVPAAGQEGPAEGEADLRGRLAAGDQHRFAMMVDTLLHLRTPGAAEGSGDARAGTATGGAGPAGPGAGAGGAGVAEQKQSAHQWVDFIVTVVETGDAGSTLELEYAGLRFTLESPDQAGSFDSAAPAVEGDPARALRRVVGTRLRVRVDREGKVTEVSGGEGLTGAAEPATGEGTEATPAEGADAGGAFWPRVAAQFRERAIVASFVEPILTTHHPAAGAARVGAAWTYRDRLEGSPLGTFTIVTEYLLESVDAGTAVIALSGSIEAGPAPAGGEPAFELLASTNRGRMVWSTAEGILDALEQTQSVELRTSMQGVRMDLENRTTVTLTRTK